MAALLFLAGCSKPKDALPEPAGNTSQFITYTIAAGQHYADRNTLQEVSLSEMKWAVIFDSSAIYTSGSAVNQYDINKLYGFSDNRLGHHQYSARIGWRFSDGALRLFAYVYNAGVSESMEIATVPINEPVLCSISVGKGRYVFTIGEVVVEMPRLSQTEKAEGYRLYPYFGGDEVAPHDIRIQIRNVK